MAIHDSYCKLSDGQAPTTNNTSYSDYSYDTANITPKNEIGAGEPMCVQFSIGVAGSASADSFVFDVVSATSGTDLSTGLKVLASRTFTASQLTIGSQHIIVIPPGANDQRYIGVRYVLGSGDTVTLDADLMPLSGVASRTYYDSGFVFEE